MFVTFYVLLLLFVVFSFMTIYIVFDTNRKINNKRCKNVKKIFYSYMFPNLLSFVIIDFIILYLICYLILVCYCKL